MKTPQQSAAVIIGGGLMGSLLAWRLARSGRQVHLVDQAQANWPESAAYTAAAMVAPISERPLCHQVVFDHGLASLNLWPKLLDELHQDTGKQVSFRQQGSLIVAHPADEAEMRQFESDLEYHQLLQRDDIQALNRQQIAELEPDLASHFERGYWLKSEAQVDNRQLLPALQQAIQVHSGQLHFGIHAEYHAVTESWTFSEKAVEGTEEQCLVDSVRSDQAPLIQSLNQLIQEAQVIDCRGVGAKPRRPDIRGVRGEVLWVDAPECRLNRPVRLLHPRYHLYLVPRADGQLQLGATEIESEDRTPVSVRSAMEMLSALWCLSPALAEARILSMESNLRPASPDHCPSIQQDSAGLSVNGLFRHGYLMAPSLLEQLQQEWNLPVGSGLSCYE